MATDERDRHLDEERAALVLERAARLDAGRLRDIGLEELREAALEAGISPVAFERALTEVEAEARAAAATPPPRAIVAPAEDRSVEDEGIWAGWRRALLGVGGFLLGLLPVILGGMGLQEDAGLIFAFVLAFQAFLWLVVRHRRRGRVMDFEIDLGVFWATLTLVLMVAFADDADEVAGIMSIVWAVGAVVGGLGVGLLRRGSDPDPRQLPPGR